MIGTRRYSRVTQAHTAPQSLWRPHNDLRICCGPLTPAPEQTFVPSWHSTEGAARAAPGAHPARRLHARVRRQPRLALLDVSNLWDAREHQRISPNEERH
jgi:hypothetical protein